MEIVKDYVYIGEEKIKQEFGLILVENDIFERLFCPLKARFRESQSGQEAQFIVVLGATESNDCKNSDF